MNKSGKKSNLLLESSLPLKTKKTLLSSPLDLMVKEPSSNMPTIPDVSLPVPQDGPLVLLPIKIPKCNHFYIMIFIALKNPDWLLSLIPDLIDKLFWKLLSLISPVLLSVIPILT